MIKKKLAEGQLYQMQEKHQTTRESPDKHTDTKPSVIKNELAEGQLYQMQELTIRQQEKAQTTRECSDKCTDTKSRVIKKEPSQTRKGSEKYNSFVV